jgi:hypothetical protein
MYSEEMKLTNFRFPKSLLEELDDARHALAKQSVAHLVPEGVARQAQTRFGARGRHELRVQSPAERRGDSTHTQLTPRISVATRFGSIDGELDIAAVAPLNTEDLH